MDGPGVERYAEADLIRRAKAGDRAAFGELVQAHQHEVYTLALRLTADRELAADVAQEALVRAWRALPRFRGEAAFSTWLHRTTVNTAWTLRRRAMKHRSVPLEEGPEPADRSVTPERAGEMTELRDDLVAALDRLNPRLRAVIVAKDVYGWSHDEIASTLGITVTAAKVRLHRARKKMKAMLGEARR